MLVRRERAAYQKEYEPGAIVNAEYRDIGVNSGSMDVNCKILAVDRTRFSFIPIWVRHGVERPNPNGRLTLHNQQTPWINNSKSTHAFLLFNQSPLFFLGSLSFSFSFSPTQRFV
ncbi:hypothetical protein L2E82_25683 [Cichorium intybus]|uniref:Uncharacterized protein n=1 Tax=Cichorium intybus TaxID=13427 RepID=A0ACB9E3R5_CICIN|nr:hypothetical protein L2E82_25683 [Cichorium intybus]